MPRLLAALVLLMGGLVCSSAPASAAPPVMPGFEASLADHNDGSIHEVRFRGGARYYRAPVYRRPPPPPVYRRPPPVPYTRPAPGPRTHGVAAPGSSRPTVLGPSQRPKVFATPGRSGGNTAGAKTAGPVAKSPTPRSGIQARLDKLPKQVGSGSGGGGGGVSKPPGGASTTGPPGGRPRLTQINRPAGSKGGLRPALKRTFEITQADRARILSRTFDLARHQGLPGYNRSGWPKNDGFLMAPKRVMLQPGHKLDRYGEGGGKFASPKGTSFERRSLPAGSERLPYQAYVVVKPLPAWAGKVSPAFGKKGMGTQYKFHKSIDRLLHEEYIKKIDE